MEIFGTPDDKANVDDGIGRLLETTLYLSPSEMRKLADFLHYCADSCEKYEIWDHEHFIDWNKSYKDGEPDIIIYQLKANN